MKFLHAADLHIDSPLRGLSAYEGAPVAELRTATRRALENLVDLARSQAVDAVVLAGDVYDGDWRDYQTGLFFARQMSALREAGIEVYLVFGNHDAESTISKKLQLPDNVHVLKTARPETIVDDKLGLAVHGQGFERRDVKENLALGYPEPHGGLFNIGLLHTALTGEHDHDDYAPCSVQELQAKGYDYWALGHVHTRTVVSQEPWIVFPGNLQGRNARETGPKGCTLVTVDDLKVVAAEHHDLDVARWAHLRVDVSAAADLDEAAQTVSDRLRDHADGPGGDRLQAVRISVTGSTAAHPSLCRDRERLVNQLRAWATDIGDIWVEKVLVATRPQGASDESLGGLVADLARTADALTGDGDRLRELMAHSRLFRALPPEARGRHRIDPEDPAWVGRVADEATQLLNAMITEYQEGKDR